ncbi:hypothetical protein HZU77_015025 [Neisseriaceae bacterium TC5R-5]|nr:hypothetical protein [Neisseriaceae bacterium TC5R-5]
MFTASPTPAFSALAPVKSLSASAQTLSPLLDGLSPHLIARFFEMSKSSNGSWSRVTTSTTVAAPLTEASMEIVLNWQSPFEQAGPESKAPALMAMLQSGALQPMITAVLGNQSQDDKGIAATAQQQSNDFLRQFEGRTGMSKLNSTQVFNGMPPIKIQVTLLLRAWRHPVQEVETPFNQLMAWALPIALSADGSILARSAQTAQGNMGYVEALMPSLAPCCIGMEYKGRLYSPLVIESISQPLSAPIDHHGHYVELLVPMTLCTLTALDRQDWLNGAKTQTISLTT